MWGARDMTIDAARPWRSRTSSRYEEKFALRSEPTAEFASGRWSRLSMLAADDIAQSSSIPTDRTHSQSQSAQPAHFEYPASHG